MGVALLLCSWSIEIVGGGWFVYVFWTLKAVRYQGISEPGMGYGFLYTYRLLAQMVRHPYPLTQEKIALFFLGVYAVFHLLAILLALIAPIYERITLGVRHTPSRREIEMFNRAFERLTQFQRSTPDAPTLKKPWRWQVRDDQSMQMRWIGWVLVIDTSLLKSPHFPALLAHELEACNSLDLVVRMLFSFLPPSRWAILSLVGIPLSCGKLIFSPLWLKYWRDRVFAADEYAARIGQRHALLRALDDLQWTMEGTRATKGGRWLRMTPYLESRKDRLSRYQLPLPPHAS